MLEQTLLLNNENFLEFAAENYIYSCKTTIDFNEDLNRIMYIKKLINRMIAGETVDCRLIMNHLIILFNVFKRNAIIAMLFFKIEKELWGVLKTFLIIFGFKESVIPYINESIEDISTVDYLEKEIKNVYSR